MELFFDSYFNSAFYSIHYAHTQTLILSFTEGSWGWKERSETAFHLHSAFSFSQFTGEDLAHRHWGFSETAGTHEGITLVPWPLVKDLQLEDPSPRPCHGHHYPLFVATGPDYFIWSDYGWATQLSYLKVLRVIPSPLTSCFPPCAQRHHSPKELGLEQLHLLQQERIRGDALQRPTEISRGAPR